MSVSVDRVLLRSVFCLKSFPVIAHFGMLKWILDHWLYSSRRLCSSAWCAIAVRLLWEAENITRSSANPAACA